MPPTQPRGPPAIRVTRMYWAAVRQPQHLLLQFRRVKHSLLCTACCRIADAYHWQRLPTTSTDDAMAVQLVLEDGTRGLHSFAEAVAHVDVQSAGTSCPLWPHSTEQFAKWQSCCQATNAALQHALWAAVKATAQQVQTCSHFAFASGSQNEPA
jgi:hypothetical protein